jgi:hypothetical protein
MTTAMPMSVKRIAKPRRAIRGPRFTSSVSSIAPRRETLRQDALYALVMTRRRVGLTTAGPLPLSLGIDAAGVRSS